MINDRPPRDVPSPTESQDVTNDTTRGINVAGRGEDAACRDFLGEELSQLPLPESQEEYFSINTSGFDQSSSSYRETVTDTTRSAGSAFYESLPYDHHAPPTAGGVRGALHEIWEEPAHESVTGPPGTSLVPSHLAFLTPQSDGPDVYNLPGGLLDATQQPLDNSTSLPPSQDNIPAYGAPDVLSPTTFNDDHVLPTTYFDNYHDHESPMPSAPILRPVRTNNVGEDPAAIFSHDTPRQRYDLPASRVYTFELEQPLAAGAQNENPCGSAAISGSLEEGPSRSRTAEPPFVNQSLISFSPSAEFDPRYEHELLRASLGSGISTRNDAGPSGSMFITSGDGPPANVKYVGNGKRKRSFSDKDEGTTRGLPRQKRNETLESSASIQPMLPPATPRWIKIEQPLYVSKNSQHNRVQQNPVDFTVAGDPGIRLTDALNPHFSGLDGRDEPMFQYPSAGSSVSFPRAPPSIIPADHKKAHNPRTRKKLAFEVAKRIKNYVEELKVGVRWEDMVLTKLVHVSKASWQPEIWYHQESASDS